MPHRQYTKMLVVAFTGHRPLKLNNCYDACHPTQVAIYNEIKLTLKRLNPSKAISGMALGVDQIAARACFDLSIPFIAAVPFKGQESKWPEKSQEYYRWLLSCADEVKIVSEGGYSAYKMQIRNQWMVNNSGLLIAVWDGSEGGTGNCVDYARLRGKPIIRIDAGRIREETKSL